MLNDLTLEQDQYQTAEVIITAAARGWRITEVPTIWHPRSSGESKKGHERLLRLPVRLGDTPDLVARATPTAARDQDFSRPGRRGPCSSDWSSAVTSVNLAPRDPSATRSLRRVDRVYRRSVSPSRVAAACSPSAWPPRFHRPRSGTIGAPVRAARNAAPSWRSSIIGSRAAGSLGEQDQQLVLLEHVLRAVEGQAVRALTVHRECAEGVSRKAAE